MRIAEIGKLKVAVIIRNFSSSGGGAEKYCYELTKELAKHYEVHVFSQKFSETLKNITYHKVPLSIKRPRFLNQLIFSVQTKFLIDRKEFNIIHSHDLVTHANVYTLHVPCFKSSISRDLTLEKIFSYLSLIFSPRKITYLLIEFFQLRNKNNKSFIAVSGYLKKNIVKNYKNIERSIYMAPPGFYPSPNKFNKIEIRKKYSLPTNAYILAFVAHGFKRKGLQEIIHALELIENQDIFIVIAGDGKSDEINFNSALVKNNSRFLGRINNTNEVYAMSDALIHPTKGDTFGMVALEAISLNIPVIISSKKFCGISEYLEPDKAIIINNPFDSLEIKDKVMEIYNNEKLNKELTKKAYGALKLFTWKETFRKTNEAYLKVLENDICSNNN